jgi:hypothetical protein
LKIFHWVLGRRATICKLNRAPVLAFTIQSKFPKDSKNLSITNSTEEVLSLLRMVHWTISLKLLNEHSLPSIKMKSRQEVKSKYRQASVQVLKSRFRAMDSTWPGI